MHAGAISERVVWMAAIEVVKPTPSLNIWGYDHFAVLCNIRGHIAIAGFAIILPAAAHVH